MTYFFAEASSLATGVLNADDIVSVTATATTTSSFSYIDAYNIALSNAMSTSLQNLLYYNSSAQSYSQVN